MSDSMTPAQRHNCMSHIRSGDTKPEMAVRRALFAAGYRYRVQVKNLPGKPDIVLPKYHTAVFVNGCFWHGHEGCSLYTVPKTNVEFWEEKVRRNKERDGVVQFRLETLGWSVITIWECELKKAEFEATMARVESQLARNLEDWHTHQILRKQNRALAKEENRARREMLAIIEEELQKEYDIPRRIVELSHTEL